MIAFSWTLHRSLNSWCRVVLIQLALNIFLWYWWWWLWWCWWVCVAEGSWTWHKWLKETKNWHNTHKVFPKLILGGDSHTATEIYPWLWKCCEPRPRSLWSNLKNGLILDEFKSHTSKHLILFFYSDFRRFLGA